MPLHPTPDCAEIMRPDFIDHARTLLSQEIWCWGRDIIRTEGNWLQQIGFQRIQPPEGHSECSSVYSLDLPEQKVVILRGFGVFYGDIRFGGIFLPRYEFTPLYTPHPRLAKQPWLNTDLPELNPPHDSQRASCATLTLDLIDWIRSYEANVLGSLGVQYRRTTLASWDNGERRVIPAEDMPREWRLLGMEIAADVRLVLPKLAIGVHNHE